MFIGECIANKGDLERCSCVLRGIEQVVLESRFRQEDYNARNGGSLSPEVQGVVAGAIQACKG